MANLALALQGTQMSKHIGHFDTPEEAYLGFFEADATQNPDAWAAMMSYPHARAAASGKTVYFETAQDYADASDWTSRVASGWVRTQGREPARLHESTDRVHLVGGWTRLNAQDEPILWNRVTYVLTKPRDSWGIQARFALGSYDGIEDDAAASLAAEAATGLVQRYYEALAENGGQTCAQLCRFPMVDVGVGEVAWIEHGAELARRVNQQTTQISNLNVSSAQSGPEGAIVAVTADHASGGSEQSIILVGRTSGSWQIAGLSRMVND